ncbi:MAG: RsmE family RNA methyltransferase [Bacillota bacterium]|jgi:16S rRNA (uracil1498-N3)-methyltransferase
MRHLPSGTLPETHHTPPQFFISPKMVLGNQIVLLDEVFRHAIVKRLGVGEVFRAVLGETVYEARVQYVAGDHIIAAITDRRRTHHPFFRIHLYPALLKGQKFDLVVEKATEIGVDSITPLITRRTIPRIDDEKALARRARWEKLAKAASEQCGRPNIPEIRRILPFQEALEGALEGQLLLAHEHEVLASGTDDGLLGLLRGVSEVSVLIGPEGGLDADEVRAALARGFKPVSLGPYILKAETASIAAAAILAWCINTPNS